MWSKLEIHHVTHRWQSKGLSGELSLKYNSIAPESWSKGSSSPSILKVNISEHLFLHVTFNQFCVGHRNRWK